MSRLVPILLAAIALPASLAAQSIPAPSTPAPPRAHGQVLSIQPLQAVLTMYSGEVERRLSNTFTLGVGGTHLDIGTERDAIGTSSADVRLRYYPGARPFEGFSVGVLAGYTRYFGHTTDETTGETEKGSLDGPSVGLALDYGWLLGASKSFYVGLGVGAKAAFVDTDTFVGDVTTRHPTARVSIGWAF